MDALNTNKTNNEYFLEKILSRKFQKYKEIIVDFFEQNKNQNAFFKMIKETDTCEEIDLSKWRQLRDEIFEKYNVFSPAMIDGIINKLQSYNDKILRSELKDNPEAMLALVNRYFHCG